MKSFFMSFVITLLLLPLAELAIAQTCTDVDLRQGASSPYHTLPVENQNPHGTCYAYAAANMLNYDLLQSNVSSNQLVSPLELAAFGGTGAVLNNGVSYDAINALRDSGRYCPRAHLDRWLNRHIGPGSEAAMISILQGNLSASRRQDFMDRVRTFRRNYRALESSSEIPPGMRSSSSIATQRLRDRMRDEHFRRVSYRSMVEQLLPDGCDCDHPTEIVHLSEHINFLDTLGEFITENESANEREIFQEIINIACEGHRIPSTNIGAPSIVWTGTDTQFLTQLDGMLNAGNPTPPVLTFCSAVFQNPAYSGISIGTGGQRMYSNPGTCGSHLVTIVARRNHPEHGCQYLIRNSWGENAHAYHSSYEEERGGIWMSRTQIANTGVNLTNL